jgi:FAD/FMN-containing dehydrogenase
MTTTTIDIAGLDGGHVTLTSEQLHDLDSRLECRLLRAGDDGWDDALLVWNGMAAKVPALVVQPTSAHDVAAAVGFARDTGCSSVSRAAATTSPEPQSPNAA